MKVTYDYDGTQIPSLIHLTVHFPCVLLDLVKEKNDPFVSIAEKGVDAFSDAQGFYLVNDLPWLQYLPSWLPGMGFLKIAKQGYIDSMNMYKKPYEMFKKRFVCCILSMNLSLD